MNTLLLYNSAAILKKILFLLRYNVINRRCHTIRIGNILQIVDSMKSQKCGTTGKPELPESRNDRSVRPLPHQYVGGTLLVAIKGRITYTKQKHIDFADF
jgi:hypothetical protein